MPFGAGRLGGKSDKELAGVLPWPDHILPLLLSKLHNYGIRLSGEVDYDTEFNL